MRSDFDKIHIYFSEFDNLSDMDKLAVMPSFCDGICELLDELSHLIKADKQAKMFPDLMTFAFFCRKANIMKLKNEHKRPNQLGRGLSFHVAPSNVPINFAYSLVVGLISGNPCIVRVSSKKFEQTDIICRLLKQIPKNNPYLKYISIIGYEHNEQITSYFSKMSMVRVIWGGDETIRQVKKCELKPRGIDILFADRYSLLVIKASEVLKEERLDLLAKKFYNDTYLYDQNACTAPHLIYWVGHEQEIKKAKKRFFSEVKKQLVGTYHEEAIIEVNKLIFQDKIAIELGKVFVEPREDNQIVRVCISALPDNLSDYTCPGGFFVEYDSGDLFSLSKVVTEKYQTLSYLGFDKEELIDFVIDNGLKGIDRIVPIGKTMDFSFIWDGYDLVTMMSRTVYKD